jgi:hypothetical protein
VAELDRVVEAVCAEISARRDNANPPAVITINHRSGTAALLSEAAGIARAGARQLGAAKSRVVDEVARAESAGYTVGDDWTVVDSA